eukprot:523668-Pleurochrysis_carterae.AAC.1
MPERAHLKEHEVSSLTCLGLTGLRAILGSVRTAKLCTKYLYIVQGFCTRSSANRIRTPLLDVHELETL